MGRKAIHTWIAEAMAAGVANEYDGPLSAMALAHVSGSAVDELRTVKFGKDKKWEPKALEKLFTDLADTHCQDLTGVHTFKLLAFFGGQTPQMQLPFRRYSKPMPGEEGLMSEPPTAEGRAAQRMRWDETVLQQTYRKQQQIDDTLLKMVGMLTEQNSQLMRENRDSFEIVKEMLLQKATEDREWEAKKLSMERWKHFEQAGLKLAPALINTITGREVFPQATEDTAIIEAFAEHLQPAQAQMLSTLLPAQLAGILMKRFEQYNKAKIEQAKQVKQLEEAQKANGASTAIEKATDELS